jgi:small-conductance mechanosensitive channel
MHDAGINKKGKELFMGTVNGKLINQELDQFEELRQRTERVNQRCQYLESQVNAISKQDYTQYLQKVTEEVDSNKSYLQKLDQRIGFLEDVTSRQARQLFFIKITSVIAFVGLWFMFSINNKPEYDKTKPHKKVESLEFIQPKYKKDM